MAPWDGNCYINVQHPELCPARQLCHELRRTLTLDVDEIYYVAKLVEPVAMPLNYFRHDL